jgi:hypothetical protein
MSIALWLIVAIVAFVALSLVVGLAIALILARICELSEALITDPLAMPPRGQELAQAEEFAIEEEALAGRNR